MQHYGTIQSQHCNNYNDDKLMHVSAWFEFFWCILMSKAVMYGGKHDNKE